MQLDRPLRNNFWILPALLVAVAGFLNAQAISRLVGVGLEVDAGELVRPPLRVSRRLPAAPAARVVSARSILARNPFDHVTGSLLPPPSTPEATGLAAPLDTSDPLSAPVCDGVDVDAIVASDDAEWSLAAVEAEGKKSLLVRRGAEVSGKRIEFIGWDRVWLSSGEGLCQAMLFAAKKSAPAPHAIATAVVSTRPPPRGAPPLDPQLRKGIVAVSATEFNIDRSVVDRILENQAELMKQAKIIPVQENGRVVGVRMLGIRPDTLLGALGMQNNDRLQTINGFEVANPEKALEAYARLRTADKLTIQVNRGGKDMNLDYNIR
jgi:general secretion pathway protein C